MTDTKPTESKADGKAFDDFFDSIGKQADQISKTTDAPITQDGDAPETSLTDDEQRVVDEIESLCMNCHANVRQFLLQLPQGIIEKSIEHG